MADAKITELSVMVAPALTDLLAVADDVAGTPETQAIQLQTVLLIVDQLTAEASIDGAADFLLMYDTSAGGVRKVLPNNLPTPTHVHAAADITTGTFADALVAASNVTQHEAALTITESQISDLGTYATTAAVTAEIAAAVAGLYDHKGSYDASTNTPDLDAAPSGILKGDAYTVSVAGTFFAVTLEAGDVLIADQDDPTLSTHWTIVNRNIDSSAFATASHTHAAADVNSGTFADARIAQSNVAQHQAAITAGDVDINGQTAEATVDGAADYVLVYDATATANRKVLIDNLPGGGGGGDTLPVVDTTGIAKGSVDATKIVRFEVDTNVPTATTVVLTVPSTDGTIALTGHVHGASTITSGQFADARIAASNVTQHQAALTITESQISDLGSYSVTGHAHAASEITSGTLAHERGGLEADVSGYGGVALIDSGTTSELKYNLTATVDPTANEDSDDGYTVGSRWINVTLDKEFVLLDATVGAAVWTETTGTAGGTGGAGSDLHGPGFGAGDALHGPPHVGTFTLSSVALLANTMYSVPVFFPESVTLTVLGMQIHATGTANNARMAIYENADGAPGALIVDSGAFSVSTSGFKSNTISQAISAGWHWVSFLMDGTATIKCYPRANCIASLGSHISGTTISPFTHLTASETYAAMPDPHTASVTGKYSVDCPFLFGQDS